MYRKPLLALLAGCLASPAIPQAAPIYANIEQIKLVSCDGGEVTGTAFRTGTGAFTTANHLTSGRVCQIDGEPVQVTWSSNELDIAITRTAVYGVPLEIDCGGMADGQEVVGIGYAAGIPLQRAISAIASDEMTRRYQWGGFTTLLSPVRFIPGMSGGPVLAGGKVVGIVNGLHLYEPLSFSQSLSETPLCA